MPFTLNSAVAGIPFQPLILTVATLPTAASSTGNFHFVTDALAPAIGATVAATGAVTCMVVSNGTNWIVV